MRSTTGADEIMYGEGQSIMRHCQITTTKEIKIQFLYHPIPLGRTSICNQGLVIKGEVRSGSKIAGKIFRWFSSVFGS